MKGSAAWTMRPSTIVSSETMVPISPPAPEIVLAQNRQVGELANLERAAFVLVEHEP